MKDTAKIPAFMICILLAPFVGVFMGLFEMFTAPFKWLSYSYKKLFL